MTSARAAYAEARARAWLAVDPDPQTRAETERLLAAGGDELESRFLGQLEFGTAGLRGRLGAGPNRMNRVIVRLAAAALGDEVAKEDDPHVVVGYDARHGSADFADDTARVLVGLGVRCTLLPRPLPTPVLSFAVRHLDASAGVMVTASHNPRDDNGYKVYGRGGALITSPVDTAIAAAMAARSLLGDDDLAPVDDPGLVPASDDVIDAYVETVVATIDPTSSRSAVAAHTALHGVGTETIRAAFAAAGFAAPATVAAQADPDPDFPTAPFPNPEEPGSLDLLLALADDVGADLALANDPDADRLAVAVPTPWGWQNLSGDDLGCILADQALRRSTDDPRPALVISTVVSSRLLARIAADHGATDVETLTGFKWIMHARAEREDHRFACGYEEALGYAVNDGVRDKDGVSAALAITELAGELKDEGRTLLDRLDELHRAHGVHTTGQRSIRFEELAGRSPARQVAMDHLRQNPPTSLGGVDVDAVHDLARGDTGLPPTDGLVFELADARLVVRPSGTEPKLKIYGETWAPPGSDPHTARLETRARLRRILHDAELHTTRFDATPAVPAGPPTPTVADTFAAVPVGRDRVDDLRLVVRCIDLTTLEGDDTLARVRALCAQARRPDVANPMVGPVAAVCVYPALVPLVAEILGGTPVRTASVAGAFPSGLSSLPVRLADIEAAVAAGADEIDIVVNRPALLEGRLDDVRDELAASRAAAGTAHLKVILEVGELDTARIEQGARLAMETGADFIKTSTGKSKVSATPQAVWTMAQAIRTHAEETGRRVGLKVAGGVRTADDALGYVALVRAVLGDEWLTPERFRFGASSLLDAVLADLDQRPPD